MKRFLLLVLFIGTFAACKKSKQARVVSEETLTETLIGNWQDQLPLSSSAFPATFSFKADRTYTRYYGQPTEQGTYQVNAGSTARTLDLTLTGTGSGTITRMSVEITSADRIVVTYAGSTAGRPFLRRP